MSTTGNPKFQALNPKQIQIPELKYQNLFRILVISALYLFKVWDFVLSIYHCFALLRSFSIPDFYCLGVGIKPLSPGYYRSSLAQLTHGGLV